MESDEDKRARYLKAKAMTFHFFCKDGDWAARGVEPSPLKNARTAIANVRYMRSALSNVSNLTVEAPVRLHEPLR